MDTLLDLLIILIIIYAFLSPILKRRPSSQKTPEPFESRSGSPQEEEKSQQEILREIESLFGYKSEEETISVSTADEEFHQITESKPETQVQVESQIVSDAISSKFYSEQKLQLEFGQKVINNFEIEAYDYEATLPVTEIDEFDYSKMDEYNLYELDKTDANSKEEIKFPLQLETMDDFKRAFIYKEIFSSPLALRMRRIKWQRNIY